MQQSDLDVMATQMLVNNKIDELLDLHARQEELIAEIMQTIQKYIDLWSK